MLQPTSSMNHEIIQRNYLPTGLNGHKRCRDSFVELERASPTKKMRTRSVSWDDHPVIWPHENPRKQFKDYDEKEIWYTRNEYEDFLFDRLRTVQCLRASGGDEKKLNSDFYCVRGLEPFQTTDAHDELNSKRRFHQSTILIEQTRQTMLGVYDPERFRLMVGPQSEMALRRAQELAALDEHEVYGRVCRRRSLLTLSTPKTTIGDVYKASASPSSVPTKDEQLSLPLAERIQKLQEWNARRLIEIYSQPGNNPFRFPIRRDSLVGNTSATRNLLKNTIVMSNRFPIRRDSLVPHSSSSRSR